MNRRIKFVIVLLFGVLNFVNASSETGSVDGLVAELEAKFEERGKFVHTSQEYEDMSSEIDVISDEIVKSGDNAVEPLLTFMRSSSKIDYRLKNKVVQILVATGTNRAKDILLKGALAEDGYRCFSTTVAAGGYLRMITSPVETAVLLQSTNKSVVDSALQHCIGITIDREFLAKLEKYVVTNYKKPAKHRVYGDYYMWERVSRIIKADPNDGFVAEKIEIMTASFKKFEEQPAMQDKRSWSEGSLLDHMCIHMVDILSEMKISKEYLEKMTETHEGLLRQCILIARGEVRDTKVKSELKDIISGIEDNTPLIRKKALVAFSKIANDKADIEFLRDISENDPTVAIVSGEETYFLVGEKLFDFHLPEGIIPEEREVVERILKDTILGSPFRRFYLRPVAKQILEG